MFKFVFTLFSFSIFTGLYNILIGLNEYNTSNGNDFYIAVGRLVNMTSEQLALLSSNTNLTRDNMTNEFGSGYSVGLYTTGCYYFSEEISTWSSQGCVVRSTS